MILPIVAYGDPVLKKDSEDISKDYPALDQLIENMFETMYHAQGVGLAAPQVGLSIRLFVIDASPFEEDDAQLKGFKKVFLNAQITEESGDKWAFNEGCLSIPDVREDVFRHDTITIEYFDENFQKHTDTYDGLTARVIQHEYDHLEGILFIDYLSPLRKRLLKSKLSAIATGKVRPHYRIKVPVK